MVLYQILNARNVILDARSVLLEVWINVLPVMRGIIMMGVKRALNVVLSVQLVLQLEQVLAPNVLHQIIS